MRKMPNYSIEQIKKLIDERPLLKEKLYSRGFLISNQEIQPGNDYPFYGNWRKQEVTEGMFIYTHKDTTAFCIKNGAMLLFLVGHAYNPYSMTFKEEEILSSLAEALNKSASDFWKVESELTGVFCIGFILDGKITYSTDCCGMQLVYHGVINDKLYISSHSRIVADLCGMEQDGYVQKLVSSRFYHYWGTWLPGDLSPYKELKRLQPNFSATYTPGCAEIMMHRYYPLEKVVETQSEKEYQETIKELGAIMHRTMQLIGEKWADKKVAISVTGGRDSMTTLACANGLYDKFDYFSYISNSDEAVDAYAADEICASLHLPHDFYTIPEESEEYRDLEAFKAVMECNAGCIGKNNENDARKRLYFSKHQHFDIEVKSWVNEMGRGWNYNKYNKKSFPRYPNAAYWRAMHKVYLSPYLIRETDRVFQDYLNKYYSEEVFERISWLDLYSWEFAWSGGEGVFLTSEHRLAYEITIPFNNRRYIEKMLTVPLEKRIVDQIPKDLIAQMNRNIAETGVVIKDGSHTNLRAFIVRCYLEIMSRIHF